MNTKQIVAASLIGAINAIEKDNWSDLRKPKKPATYKKGKAARRRKKKNFRKQK